VSLEDGQAEVDFDANQSPVQALTQSVDKAGGAMHMFAATLLLDLEGVKDKAAANKVQAALKKVKGVRAAAIRVEKKQATVEFTKKGSVTLKQLVGAVQKAGYKVRLARPAKKE
jgi:copper chaperone CopZ